MSVATVIPPGGGELIGDSAERRVEIVCDDDALHATVSRFAGGREGADLHVHRRHTDLFYVLAGELTVRLGVEDEPLRVPAGTLARVPALVVHGFRNAGDADVRYLNLHAPGQGFADYLRALRDGRDLVYDQEPPPPDGGRPASEAVLATGAVLADTDEIAVAELRAAPGATAPRHLHRRHAESLYVLDGELAVTAGDAVLRAPAGAWVHLPAGVVDTVAAAGGEPARYLDVHAPGFALGKADEEHVG
jgi:quercetin dioxygenase-like cupin family protein